MNNGKANINVTLRPSYRIGFLNSSREVYNHVSSSLQVAAQRIGHELVCVRNSDEIIESNLDFVLAVSIHQPKTTEIPTFGIIHQPRMTFWERETHYQNLLTYDGYLTISDTLHQFLMAFCAGLGKPGHIGYFYTTPQQQTLECDLEKLVMLGTIRLCYFGTNEDQHWRPQFRELTQRHYFQIYNFPVVPDFSHSDDSVLFDDQYMQRIYASFGIGLVILSRDYVLDDVISNRIFEIVSVGAVAICPDIPWIRTSFGDTVLYYSIPQFLVTPRQI